MQGCPASPTLDRTHPIGLSPQQAESCPLACWPPRLFLGVKRNGTNTLRWAVLRLDPSMNFFGLGHHQMFFLIRRRDRGIAAFAHTFRPAQGQRRAFKLANNGLAWHPNLLRLAEVFFWC